MKIRLKQFSKSTLSVVLTLCMIFSCATVGLVATDAAQVEEGSTGAQSESENVGAEPEKENVGAQSESDSVGTTVPSGRTFYLDVTNFSGDYSNNGNFYMSLSGNGTTIANKSNTSGAASYVPKNDNSWVQMTHVSGLGADDSCFRKYL